MRTCTVCRFEAEQDDVVLRFPSGTCLCLRCYGHETGAERPMPALLRRQLEATLAAAA